MTIFAGLEWVDKILGVTIFAILVAVFMPLERLVPFHDQPVLRRNWYHDLSFWVINRPVVFAGAVLMFSVALLVRNQVVPEAIVTSVGELPLWLGVPLAILVADLTFYAVHRASHTFPVMWQFHAVHHSIRDMDWLAGGRVHPADQLITTITGTIYLWQSRAVHSNVNIPLGPFAWIFVGPRFHHWHHSTDALAQDRNFAGQLAFIDWIFGTAYYPNDRLPTKYGCADPVPDSYVGTLLYPVKRLIRMADGTLQETPEPEIRSMRH